MNVFGQDLINNIFSFVPIRIGETMKEDATIDEIRELVREKVEDYEREGKEPVKYLFRVVIGKIVRFTILCNEYISEILLYDLNNGTIIRWDIDMDIKKRDVLSLPMNNKGLYQYGIGVTIKDLGDDKFELKHVLGSKKSIIISKERLYNFLKGGDDQEIMDLVYKRVEFLDYDIIEHLANTRDYYYNLIDLVKLLYNMGYWTYGGLKNYNVIYPRYIPNINLSLGRGKLRFTLNIDGTIANVNITDNTYSYIIDDLVGLGAKIEE